jgi:hypothetical protein
LTSQLKAGFIKDDPMMIPGGRILNYASIYDLMVLLQGVTPQDLNLTTKLKILTEFSRFKSDCYRDAYLLTAFLIPMLTHPIYLRSNHILGPTISKSSRTRVILALAIGINAIGLPIVHRLSYYSLLLLNMKSKSIDLDYIFIQNNSDKSIENTAVKDSIRVLHSNDLLIYNKDLFLKYLNAAGYSNIATVNSTDRMGYIATYRNFIKFNRALLNEILYSDILTNIINFYSSIEMYLLTESNKANLKIINLMRLNFYTCVINKFSPNSNTLSRFHHLLRAYTVEYYRERDEPPNIKNYLFRTYCFDFLGRLRPRLPSIATEINENILLNINNHSSDFRSKYNSFKTILNDGSENQNLIDYLNEHSLVFPFKNPLRVPYYEYRSYLKEFNFQNFLFKEKNTNTWGGIALLASCLINYGFLKYLKIIK